MKTNKPTSISDTIILVEDEHGVELCKCINCDLILIDENPQVGAKKYDLDRVPEAREMHFVQNDEEMFWGCPECEQDGCLIDI